MITGILNSNTPLDLNKSSLEKHEILEINYSNHEIILLKDQKKLDFKSCLLFLQHLLVLIKLKI